MNSKTLTPLQERTLPGLHKVLEWELTQCTAPGKTLIDLGAGTGAWAKRLSEKGYSVTAMEAQPKDFQVDSVPIVMADLNENFSEFVPRKFDWVTAIEVVEHLENPRHFLRQVKKLLMPKGIAIITTPNIECLPGRLSFLYRGELRMFGSDPKFNEPTHMTPIHSELFKKAVAETGLTLEKHSFNCPEARASTWLGRLLSAVLSMLTKGCKGGDIHIFILRN